MLYPLSLPAAFCLFPYQKQLLAFSRDSGLKAVVLLSVHSDPSLGICVHTTSTCFEPSQNQTDRFSKIRNVNLPLVYNGVLTTGSITQSLVSAARCPINTTRDIREGAKPDGTHPSKQLEHV